ncbi:hypothetical protein [Geminisphaera colitermitum]|uniref:hypothetical protein n=1 Tax=Geminisphaera colitermitum TaxID=1148786 RepID=UPI0005BA6D07|nr:hypothetical protein [Geminisphaera colitermitum]
MAHLGRSAEDMQNALRTIIFIAIIWTLSLYAENILTHAYYRGLTLPQSAREKLTDQEIAEVAERTEERFTNSWVSWLPPALTIAVAAYALWNDRKTKQKNKEVA